MGAFNHASGSVHPALFNILSDADPYLLFKYSRKVYWVESNLLPDYGKGQILFEIFQNIGLYFFRNPYNNPLT